MKGDGAAGDGRLGVKPEHAELSSITYVLRAPLCGHPASWPRAEAQERIFVTPSALFLSSRVISVTSQTRHGCTSLGGIKRGRELTIASFFTRQPSSVGFH